jgi:predicted RNA-binding Zn ribbon-like protein
MHSHEQHFEFIGNNLAIDFVNTEMISRGELVDLLPTATELVRWAHQAGFDIRNRVSVEDLSTVKTLRKALKALFQARIEGQSVGREALAIINRHLANHATHQVLQAGTKAGDYQLVADREARNLDVILAELAYEAAQLLASPQAARLKRCGNTECILIFLDTSRSQKRRWCSMETCGNRAKVAKHYRSHQAR